MLLSISLNSACWDVRRLDVQEDETAKFAWNVSYRYGSGAIYA